MFKNYFIITWRNILKYKSYSLINITGLALGLTCTILVLLAVQRDYSINQDFSKAKQLYRISSEWKDKDMGASITTLAPLGPLLLESFPEIVNANRSWPGGVVVKIGDKNFRESMNITEPSFFEMFDFPFIVGNHKTALKMPNSVVITEGLAEKFFGTINVLNEVITFQTWAGEGAKDYKINWGTEETE